MQWYNGGIAEAVGQSKVKGAIFVVYIEGKDEKSEAITNVINSQEVSSKLGSDNFVAIKIEGNSLPHQQFSELYKGSSVPSIYFIGKNGVPLDVITEPSDIQTFSKKLDDILQRGGVCLVQNNALETLLKTEQTHPEKPANVVCENGVCTIKREEPSSSKSVPEGDNPDISAEDKLERAKKLLEIKRLEKEKEEKENERLKELERRKMGQNVQKMKQWQEDQELKQLKEEREKEKRQEKEARDRVLAQIAQDKAERASKFSSSTQQKSAQESVPSTSRADSNVARLQFKLPDGSSNTNDFQALDTLDTAVKYIKSNLNLPFTNFTMSTTFPRRQFTSEDYSRTLADLQLTPNAVILILPLNHGTVTTNPGPGGVTGFIWALLTPLLQLFGFLKSFVFGSDPGHVSGDGNNKDSGSSSGSRNTVVEVRSKYDFENRVKSAGSKLIVIDCFASWCGPCRMIAPMLEDLAKENPTVVFLKINVDDNGGIVSGVSALPTFVFMKKGRELTRITGADYYQVKSTVQRYK